MRVNRIVVCSGISMFESALRGRTPDPAPAFRVLLVPARMRFPDKVSRDQVSGRERSRDNNHGRGGFVAAHLPLKAVLPVDSASPTG